jgi:predicted DNA-binding transcriptional regulator AlpA
MTDHERAVVKAALQNAASAVQQAIAALQENEALQHCDRLLSAREASKRTGMSTRWLYLHADELPFAVRVGAHAIRYSDRGIDKWLANQLRSKIS